jgi:hypothetical protein
MLVLPTLWWMDNPLRPNWAVDENIVSFRMSNSEIVEEQERKSPRKYLPIAAPPIIPSSL